MRLVQSRGFDVGVSRSGIALTQSVAFGHRRYAGKEPDLSGEKGG